MATAILAVQGAFAEHAAMLDELGEPWFELRCLRNMSRHFDRLILPGGESTVQGRLLREEGMLSTIRALVEDGMPVLGTCAGLILLAERVIDDDDDSRPIRPESHLGTMHVTVERNAYGRPGRELSRDQAISWASKRCHGASYGHRASSTCARAQSSSRES